MGSNGQFGTIKLLDSDQRFASPYLRVYPPTIALAPNEAWVVKVELAKTKSDKKNKETHDTQEFDISWTSVFC